jgi:hypothetical protein
MSMAVLGDSGKRKNEKARCYAGLRTLLYSVGSEYGGGGGNRTRGDSLYFNQVRIKAGRMLSNCRAAIQTIEFTIRGGRDGWPK